MNTERLADVSTAAPVAAAPAALQAAFDRAAADYDSAFNESVIGRLQRAAVWKQIDALFQPGDQVLDLGCGTALDAVYLAERGVRVHGIDISPQMIDAARRRVREQGLEDKVTCEAFRIEDLERLLADRRPPTSTRVLAAQSPGFEQSKHPERVQQSLGPRDEARFDGVLSNFGALNCVRDMRPLAKTLSGLLHPGGRLAICVMNRFCLWELCYYAVRGQVRKATRRLRPGGARATLGSLQSFSVYYPSRRQLMNALGPDFRLIAVSGIGIFVPPSYLEKLAIRSPVCMRLFDRMDRVVSSWHGFRSVADHHLLIFENRG